MAQSRAATRDRSRLSPVRAVAMGAVLPRTMRGRNNAVAVENLNNFQVRNDSASKVFQAMYAGSTDKVLNGTGRETFDAVKLLQSIEKPPYQPAGANIRTALRRQPAADRAAHQGRRRR